MANIENNFYVKNYTDTEWAPKKSASFKVIQKAYYDVEEVLELTVIIDGHIDFRKLTNQTNFRLRNLLESKLLDAFDYQWTEEDEDQNKLRIIVGIMDSLSSWRWFDNPECRRTTHSPKRTTKIEQYSIWRDDSY